MREDELDAIRDIADAYTGLTPVKKSKHNILRQPIWGHSSKEAGKAWYELQVIERLIYTLGGDNFSNLRKPEFDNPDGTVIYATNTSVGIDVTELIDDDTAKDRRTLAQKTSRHSWDWKVFSSADYSHAIQWSINEKLRKLRKSDEANWVKRYDEAWLLIHTAEPDLAYGQKNLSLTINLNNKEFQRVFVVGEMIPCADNSEDVAFAFGEVLLEGSA